jgi:phenylacetate-CoA ligase
MPPSAPFPKHRAILGHQFDQLRAMLRLLAGSNPFYTRKFEAADTSGKMRHLGEFTETVPFTTRQELIEDARAHPPFGSNLTFPLNHYVRCHQCQDSQGNPWRWLDTAESWQTIVANGEEVFRAAEVRAADRIFFVSSFEQYAGPWLSFESGALSRGLCFSGAGLDSGGQWEAICATETTLVCGAPSLLKLLVEAARQPGAPKVNPAVRLVLAGGQPGDAEATRIAVSALWPQARVFAYYALAEAGVVAFECPARPDLLHLVEPAIFPEIIDPATGRTREAGEAGELVLTTLFRPGSPLLRYRTGDMFKISPDIACECGRNQLALQAIRRE